MKLYKEINILEDEKTYNHIVRLSVWLLLGTAAVVGIGLGVRDGGWQFSFRITDLLWFVGLNIASLPVHELIHGLFFRVFSQSGKIKFGFQKGMLYASNPNETYSKNQFAVIIFAPFLLNSLLFYILSRYGINEAVLWGVFVLHTSGCAGDFWYIHELIKHPSVTHCEDTPVGINLYCSPKQ